MIRYSLLGLLLLFFILGQEAEAQATGTCTAGTEFCEASTSVSTSTYDATTDNTNDNTNTNTSTSTSTATSTSDSTVDQTVTSTATATNTNTNNNVSENVSESTSASTVSTTNQNVNQNQTDQNITQRIYGTPPSAIAPSIGSSYSQDLCTTGVSGSVSTQLLGMSSGRSVTDENCERIKLSKTLFDMGMKVAAVSLMCQDERVFAAMAHAGTYCPYEGQIGNSAQVGWESNPNRRPDYEDYIERQRMSFMESCTATQSERQCRRNWLDLQG
tara:strand:+ start:435 stop:1250 length:816 start_codon:yes stop_codon:yes gene_type:complete